MARRFVMRLRRPDFTGVRTPVATVAQSAGRLSLVGVVSGLLAGLAWVATTQTETGQRLADLALFGRETAGPQGAGVAAEILSNVSVAAAVTAATGLGALALARGGMALVVAAAIAIAGANLTSQLLKDLVERPALLGSLAYARGNSFPSGTVTIVASIGLVATLVAPRRLRGLTALITAVGTCAVGMSTVVAGWHRLADVIGAILISLAWTALCAAGLARVSGWMPRRSWRTGLGGGTILLGGVAGAVALAIGGIVLVAVATDPAPIAEALRTLADAPRAFLAALAIVGGTALLSAVALLWGLRGVALELPD
ncbi:MAG: phosphatase PAP2 family protein [Chloroflexota bacterium]